MIRSAIVNKNYLLLKTLTAPGLSCPFCHANGKMMMSFYQVQLNSGWVWNTKRVTAVARCNNCTLDVRVMQSLKDLNDFYTREKRNMTVVASFNAGNKRKIRVWLAIMVTVFVALLLLVLYLAV